MQVKGHLRDCREWENQNLSMSTCSNEAVKLYDAGLHQLIGWFEDETLGGLSGTCQKMLEADPNFIMGKVFTCGLDLLGTGRTTRLDTVFAQQLTDLKLESEKPGILEREKLHVLALGKFASGNLPDATKVWESILIDYPTDILALKLSNDTYFYLGDQVNIRDSVARVVPEWKPTLPLYGYVKGLLSFGQEETNLFKEAESSAREALAYNKNDSWAVHTMAHIYEMYGQTEEGSSFLKLIETDWKPCSLLACHLYWHWTLYYTEKGDYESALQLFDQELGQRCRSSGAMLDIVDAASLLYRLQLEGVSVESRWQDIVEVCRSHMDDHVLAFNDCHFLMTFLGVKNNDLIDKHMDSLVNYMKNENSSSNGCVTDKVGLKLCQSMIDYSIGDFDKVVEKLYPLRNDIVLIGGSHAQRDVFNQLLINACLKSSIPGHQKLARILLNERKVLKPNSLLTDRLMARLLSCHL